MPCWRWESNVKDRSLTAFKRTTSCIEMKHLVTFTPTKYKCWKYFLHLIQVVLPLPLQWDTHTNLAECFVRCYTSVCSQIHWESSENLYQEVNQRRRFLPFDPFCSTLYSVAHLHTFLLFNLLHFGVMSFRSHLPYSSEVTITAFPSWEEMLIISYNLRGPLSHTHAWPPHLYAILILS